MMADEQRKPKNLGVLLMGFSPAVHEGLRAILTKDESIKVIGDAPNEQEAIQHIKRAGGRGQPVNVVLTETLSDKVDCVQATKLIKAEFPE